MRLRGVKASSTSEANKSSSEGGQLFPDETERDLFWVSIEGKKVLFPIELYAIMMKGGGRFDARWFDDEQVDYARLLADPDVAESEQLVMKSGDTGYES